MILIYVMLMVIRLLIMPFPINRQGGSRVQLIADRHAHHGNIPVRVPVEMPEMAERDQVKVAISPKANHQINHLVRHSVSQLVRDQTSHLVNHQVNRLANHQKNHLVILHGGRTKNRQAICCHATIKNQHHFQTGDHQSIDQNAVRYSHPPNRFMQNQNPINHHPVHMRNQA